MHLFLVHDAAFFCERLSPALADSARRRTFAPLRQIAAEMEVAIESSGRRDRLTSHERPLILTSDSPFDRRLWRHYAGELLLYAAAETPSFPVAPDLLTAFLPPNLVDQIHSGSREVQFEGVPYRPGMAGLHNQSDVAELAVELAAIQPEDWIAEAIASADDPIEELVFARQRFDDLRSMIASAHARGQVIVCEEI